MLSDENLQLWHDATLPWGNVRNELSVLDHENDSEVTSSFKKIFLLCRRCRRILSPGYRARHKLNSL